MKIKFNIFDLIFIGLFILGLFVFFVLKTGHSTSAREIIKNKSQVEFDVLLDEKKISGVGDFFKLGGKSFITIRNVPYTALEVVKSRREQLSAENPAYPYAYNYLVTLKDEAIITDDGPVIGGNKIKTGLPIILEGFDYKLGGVVSDVRVK